MSEAVLNIEEVINADKIYAVQFDGKNGRDIKTLLEGNEFVLGSVAREEHAQHYRLIQI